MRRAREGGRRGRKGKEEKGGRSRSAAALMRVSERSESRCKHASERAERACSPEDKKGERKGKEGKGGRLRSAAAYTLGLACFSDAALLTSSVNRCYERTTNAPTHRHTECLLVATADSKYHSQFVANQFFIAPNNICETPQCTPLIIKTHKTIESYYHETNVSQSSSIYI